MWNQIASMPNGSEKMALMFVFGAETILWIGIVGALCYWDLVRPFLKKRT